MTGPVCPKCGRVWKSKRSLANHRGGRRKNDTLEHCMMDNDVSKSLKDIKSGRYKSTHDTEELFADLDSKYKSKS